MNTRDLNVGDRYVLIDEQGQERVYEVIEKIPIGGGGMIVRSREVFEDGGEAAV